MRKIPETITEEELMQILKFTKKKHHILAFLLGFYQCMRISEITNLKPEHIDEGRQLIMIKQGKGQKDRNIPIAPEIMKGLKYLPVGSKKAKDRGVRALQIAFKKKCKEVLGRTDVHFHTLRHSGITHYLTKKKWNSLEVQRLAGHSKVSITEIYTHINPTHLVERMWGESKE
jgi:integrase/recombinase XerD